MTILIVTGTGTGVGKTVVTAALTACAAGSVAVVKPAQTGVAEGEPGDMAEVTRLSGCTDVHEFARYPDPLSPHHAARVSGLPALDLGAAVWHIAELEGSHDLVIVEGAGGVLVPFDDDGHTLLDFASELGVSFVVVTSAGLGTLNHTALTMQVLDDAGADVSGLVVGSWPAEPGLAERCNLADLAQLGGHHGVSGVMPDGMAAMRDFREQARAALAPHFGGTFDWPAFSAGARP